MRITRQSFSRLRNALSDCQSSSVQGCGAGAAVMSSSNMATCLYPYFFACAMAAPCDRLALTQCD